MWKCLTQAGHCRSPFPFLLTEAQALSFCSVENLDLGSDFVTRSRSFCCILAVVVVLEKKSALQIQITLPHLVIFAPFTLTTLPEPAAVL